MKISIRVFRLLLVVLIAVVLVSSFFLIDGFYLLTQGMAMASSRSGMEDIDDILRRKDLSPAEREFLLLVGEIRKFAIQELEVRF